MCSGISTLNFPCKLVFYIKSKFDQEESVCENGPQAAFEKRSFAN